MSGSLTTVYHAVHRYRHVVYLIVQCTEKFTMACWCHFPQIICSYTIRETEFNSNICESGSTLLFAIFVTLYFFTDFSYIVKLHSSLSTSFCGLSASRSLSYSLGYPKVEYYLIETFVPIYPSNTKLQTYSSISASLCHTVRPPHRGARNTAQQIKKHNVTCSRPFS